ncbi:NAD(P)-binding domain-containing protein [Cryobacterium sp. SO2]|uniref:NADPH-dependent F420 reductase n=1 Tax=Cryobacterium sp. SO2 TaxID=1897060 RepID=UPI00223DF270|nr:NAD(P)-binding domain-containing protein [Cryobacterium sp. SO2]WEO77347.1 NAD(P)-binding domain-containing protein [Cryobacterium sp. SO2]
MVSTIGILGAGRVGSAIARTALKAGYAVHIAGSGPAADIQLIVDIVTPGAVAMTAADVAATADLVVLAVPMHKFHSVDPGTLAGRIAIDTMNYWQPIDGNLHEFTADARSSSEVVAAYFADARLVKTLNHIGYHDLETDARPAGDPERHGLAIAGDVESAAVVAEVINRFGFDPVYAGPLEAGADFEPGSPIFGGRHTAAELAIELGLAEAA